MKTIILTLALLVVAYQVQTDYSAYLQDIARQINQSNTSWTADENPEKYKGVTFESLKRLQGGKGIKGEYKSNKSNVQKQEHTIAKNIPESFDAREAWPNCSSIKEIRNQGNCGSCWAFGGVEAFSDRWCIASGQKEQVRMSSQNLLTCCDYCGMGCDGGYNPMVWDYFQNVGVVSGNLYEEDGYCQPYTIPPSHHGDYTVTEGVDTPPCSYKCTSSYTESTYGKNLHYTKSTGIIVDFNLEAIQTEIMTNGPVEVLFFVYEDFYAYKNGVYQHKTGKNLGGHAVKILGWGVEKNQPYWLVANSWGTEWGDKGFFKILRGVDECGIEHEITYGQPDIKN